MKNAALLEYYKKRLEAYLDAELAILRGQSYRIGSRSLQRADLPAVQNEIRRLEGLLEGGCVRKRGFRVVPRDL